MAIVTGDRYLDSLVKFVDKQAGPLLEGTLVLKLNPVGLHYVQSRIEALQELEGLLAGAPVDYLRAYISDLGDHRALEQLRRILRLLTSLKVVSVLPPPARDPTPVSLLPFGRLKVLELRGCDLSTSAARGLLELRHTLEKIICHNSTDALRHVFTSRIADINESPVWSRLTFVSCACNDLLVMDESLQLLPVVETLDLSRNRFAKIDNLRKCTKLRHLDLGFNHLRTITSFSEVSCSIVQLVLRNNALIKLHGIENLKSLEGLDLSYNVISIFSELEILASLPNLQSLWLEGNPICCARWYRSQVFSFFTHPEKLKLDEKGISPREFWNRQIILASRQKRPSGFGFYSPAKDGAEEGSTNIKRKKLSRLACIENEEQKRYICSESADQESGSCDSEVRSREENAISDGEAEIINLINKVECMKKESSVLWLREVKEWMDEDSENMVRQPDKENYMKKGKSNRYFGESSRSAADLVQTSADESSTNILESDHSFAESSVGLHDHSHFNSIGEAASEPLLMDGNIETRSGLRIGGTDLKKGEPLKVKNSNSLGRLTAHYGIMMDAKVKNKALTAIDDIMSTSSSALPGSPPHYQEDILHRRHNLEEEFMQLSAESHSVASSDSDSSCSDDDFCEYGTSIREADRSLSEGFSFRSVDENSQILRSDSYYDENPHVRLNGRSLFISPVDHALSTLKTRKPGQVQQLCSTGVPAVACDGGSDDIMSQEMDHLEKIKCKRKPKSRLVSLPEENDIVGCSGNSMLTSRKLNGISDVCKIELENGPGRHHLGSNDIQESHEVRRLRTKEQTWVNANQTPPADGFGGSPSGNECASFHETDEFIRKYFHSIFAESRAKETCLQYMRCDCIFVQEPGYREREVVVILSSENKFYVLLIDAITDGSGTISGVIGCHCFEEVSEVVFGIGLQVLSVHVKGDDVTYLFITRSIEKSRQLLCLLQVCDSSVPNNRCSLKSLEQLQVELLEKHIYGGLKMSIFLYSMLLFWRNDSDEELWLSRSLILAEGHVLVCIEDLVQFSALSMDNASSSQYFMLDCCCSVDNISEMVIELEESHCVTLTLDHVLHKNCCFPLIHEKQKSRTAELEKEKITAGSPKWKLKWFSEETLFKFVALLKASHVETTASPLPVRYIS